MATKTAWTVWIWFAGAAVWWVSAALAVHYNHRLHAILSLGVSAVFFHGIAGPTIGRPLIIVADGPFT